MKQKKKCDGRGWIMEKATEKELEELRDVVLEIKPKPLEIDKKLIYDGKQYSLRFPKRFIEEAEIDIKKDEFHIKVNLPDPSTKEKPDINVELKRHD